MALQAAFGICALVGGVLMLMSMTALAREGPTTEGMLLMTVCMGVLMLFGLSGVMGVLPWT